MANCPCTRLGDELRKICGPISGQNASDDRFIVLVGQGKVPAWIVAIIVCRIGSNWFTVVISRTWRSNGSSLARKSKTATQMVAIILLFINNIPFSALHLPLDQIMLYACLIFTIYSGVDYFAKNKDVFKGSM